ncbi:MAG: prepilin-type N-terminal cleavage/methylation domain-containing protein [Phycisphaerae bacterium]
MRRTAFTLVEMMIVVVILAILAGVAIPYIDDESDEARVASAQNILRTVDTAVDVYRLRYTMPNYPPTVMPTWFAGRALPLNPFADFATSVEVVNVANAVDPVAKTLDKETAPYWYNRANGVFRARVPDQGSAGLTQRLYERVNAVGRLFTRTGGELDPIKPVDPLDSGGKEGASLGIIGGGLELQ